MSLYPVREGLKLDGLESYLLGVVGQSVALHPRAAMDSEAIDLYREGHNARMFQDFLRTSGRSVHNGSVAMDAADHNAGLFLAQELTSRAARALEQPRKKLSGLEIFPVNTEVKPGAINHTVKRVEERGKASLFRGAGQRPIPRVSLAQKESIFPVRHLVDAFEFSLFEQNSANFASFAMFDRGVSAARRAIDEYENDLIWSGSVLDGLYGVLNYPHLDKVAVATTFAAATDVDTMCSEILKLIQYAENNSGMTFQSDSVAISHKLWNFLSRTRVKDSTGNGSGVTALKYIQAQAEHIPAANWHKVSELADMSVGGATVQGVFCFRKDEDVIRVVSVQPTTPLPLQTVGFLTSQFMYRSYGGVVMPNVGACVLGYVTLSE